MNTYTWDCKTVDTYPTYSEMSDVVYNVHWRLGGADESGEHSVVVIGTQTITLEDLQPEGFIPFEDVTHEIVVEWVESAMGEERIAELYTSLDSQIADKIAPKSVTKTIGASIAIEEPIANEATDESINETAPGE
tara:strand:- start:59 stop:463 length:405 start_codon:yes stop_codon:yes gene_type:complete